LHVDPVYEAQLAIVAVHVPLDIEYPELHATQTPVPVAIVVAAFRPTTVPVALTNVMYPYAQLELVPIVVEDEDQPVAKTAPVVAEANITVP